MNFEYIKEYYKVPAEYGRVIIFQGNRKGIITQDKGNYIGVNFNDKKPGHTETLHPTYEVKYLGIGKVRSMTKGQLRYQDYLAADYFSGTFIEWLCSGYFKTSI